MGKLITQSKIKNNKVYVKFVDRANMWCRTHWDDAGHQILTWSSERPKE